MSEFVKGPPLTAVQMKRAWKRNSRRATPPLAGIVAAASMLLAGSASAAVSGPTTDKPLRASALSQEITLNEEEMADVSLTRFRVFDRETSGQPRRIRVGHCRGCGGCRHSAELIVPGERRSNGE
jgi:hypothetical protein